MKTVACLITMMLLSVNLYAQIDEDCKTDVEVVKLTEPIEANDKYEVYGKAWTASKYAMNLVAAVKGIESYEGKTIQISGEVTEVCQTKGCWMILTNAGKTARVHFEDYGFFVPSDISGRSVDLRGTIRVKDISEEQAKHYAEDAEPGSSVNVTGPVKEYTIIASSVKIYK
jgi:RecJ-like exonuclease